MIDRYIPPELLAGEQRVKDAFDRVATFVPVVLAGVLVISGLTALYL